MERGNAPRAPSHSRAYKADRRAPVNAALQEDTMVTIPSPSVDTTDVARFERLGSEWWNPNGPMQALHKLNPLRVGYIRDKVVRHFSIARAGAQSVQNQPLGGIRMLDIGCGAGILCEPLARLGASVTGIDPSSGTIEVARRHAGATRLSIEYKTTSLENLAAEGALFDAVLAMEVVEHVVDMPEFVRLAGSMVRPGGLLFVSTLNRTLKSFALAIVGAEYILRWVAKGTHQWEKFVTPAELEDAINRGGLRLTDESGFSYNPLRGTWFLGRDTGVNYVVTAVRDPRAAD